MDNGLAGGVHSSMKQYKDSSTQSSMTLSSSLLCSSCQLSCQPYYDTNYHRSARERRT